MPYELMRIPFYFNRVFKNFSKTQGLIGINKTRIELQYSNVNFFLGGEVDLSEQIVIPMEEVTHFSYTVRGNYIKIRIKVKDPAFTAGFPSGQNGEIKVNIKKRFQRLVSEVNTFLICRIRELQTPTLLEAPME